MDTWKFYDITHRDHVVCNPASVAKLDRLIERLALPQHAHVLDIACGKGEFLRRLAKANDIQGIGVDLSPYYAREAHQLHASMAPDAQLQFIEMDAAEYEPEPGVRFDLVSCLGASWIYKGHRGTLTAMRNMAKPGGWVVAGEPYWRHEPSANYLQASGEKREDFGTHAENAAVGQELGMSLAMTLVSNEDEWDEYESQQWHAAERYGREHPDDPDVAELLRRVDVNRRAYLSWGRQTLGWAIYVFLTAS